MQRREFLEAIIISTVFPAINESGREGRWELDRVEGNGGRIVFVHYDTKGEPDGEAIIGGETGDWSVRKSIWDDSKEVQQGFNDRAIALNEAMTWMENH